MEKLGLDSLRKQLLETSLQGRDEYDHIEQESLRLFRDLHQADPLFRRLGSDRMDNKPKLTIRRMFGSGATPSGSSSAASSSSFRTLSDVSRRSGSSTPAKRVYLTEVPEETVDEPADAEPDVAEDDAESSLEAAIQREAQAFATELEDAEQDGMDPAALEALEANFESAAETVVTMREARTRLQEIRKDRGYKKAAWCEDWQSFEEERQASLFWLRPSRPLGWWQRMSETWPRTCEERCESSHEASPLHRSLCVRCWSNNSCRWWSTDSWSFHGFAFPWT